MYRNVHHIGFAQNGLAANIASDGIAVYGAEPETQRVLQLTYKN